MANRWYNQFVRTPHNYRVDLDCNFVVDPANGNGLGIRNLKGSGFSNVFMHTTATAPTGVPPVPAGYIYVQLQDSFQRYFTGSFGFVPPLSGTNIAVDAGALTVGTPYTITSVGTSTAADWIALGVPSGIIPAPGVTFIALVTGTGTGSGQVQTSGVPGIDVICPIGDPNTTINSVGTNIFNTGAGSYMILKCLFEGALATPNTGTVISLKFEFSNTKITVDGE